MATTTTKRLALPKNAAETAEWLITQYRPIAGAQAQPDAINVFDVFQQAAMTDLVRRALQTAWETVPGIGDQIAPLIPVNDRTIKRGITEIAAFGIGQFRAPNASPKIFAPRINFTEEVTELLILDEMMEIKEELWLRMNSPTPAIRARAGLDLTTMGKALQIRNENLTELMRWTAFKGNPLIVNFDDGQQISISYPYAEGHKPTAVVPWTDHANATPIDDMRSWQQVIANEVGIFGIKFHMNNNTWFHLQRSNQARGYLTPTDRNLYLPRAEDITGLLYGAGPTESQGGKLVGTPQIIVSDAGYRDESQGFNRGATAMTKFLQDGEVLLTTDYIFEGEHIADVPDGLVAVAVGWNQLDARQGPQTEITVDTNASRTQMLRQASSRIVRLRRPGCFLLGRAF